MYNITTVIFYLTYALLITFIAYKFLESDNSEYNLYVLFGFTIPGKYPMRQIKEEIYSRFYARQQQFGGYTGKDLKEIASLFGFDRRTLKRNLEKWSKTDPHFVELKYIGKHSIPLTLEDIMILNQLRERKDKVKKSSFDYNAVYHSALTNFFHIRNL